MFAYSSPSSFDDVNHRQGYHHNPCPCRCSFSGCNSYASPVNYGYATNLPSSHFIADRHFPSFDEVDPDDLESSYLYHSLLQQARQKQRQEDALQRHLQQQQQYQQYQQQQQQRRRQLLVDRLRRDREQEIIQLALLEQQRQQDARREHLQRQARQREQHRILQRVLASIYPQLDQQASIDSSATVPQCATAQKPDAIHAAPQPTEAVAQKSTCAKVCSSEKNPTHPSLGDGTTDESKDSIPEDIYNELVERVKKAFELAASARSQDPPVTVDSVTPSDSDKVPAKTDDAQVGTIAIDAPCPSVAQPVEPSKESGSSIAADHESSQVEEEKKSIQKAHETLNELQTEFFNIVGNHKLSASTDPESKIVLEFEYLLETLLGKIDGISTHGDSEVRKRRRQLVKAIEKELNIVDSVRSRSPSLCSTKSIEEHAVIDNDRDESAFSLDQPLEVLSIEEPANLLQRASTNEPNPQIATSELPDDHQQQQQQQIPLSEQHEAEAVQSKIENNAETIEENVSDVFANQETSQQLDHVKEEPSEKERTSQGSENQSAWEIVPSSGVVS